MPRMKIYGITLLTAFMVIFSLVAGSQTKTPANPLPPSASGPDGGADDPDMPAIAHGRISERDYLRKRNEHIGMLRGAKDLARNPHARAQAISKMAAQEQALRQKRAVRPSAKVTPPPAWTPLGPDPIPNGQTTPVSSVSGRVTAIAIDPKDTTGNTVYVGTAQGGVYRSTDGGAHWTALLGTGSDNAQSLAIGALTLDPTDNTVLFVGTGEGNFSGDSFFGVGLYIITGANGSNFALNGPFHNSAANADVFTGSSITKILVNPGNHSQILVSTTLGFSGRSEDLFSTIPSFGVYLSTNVFTSGSTVGTPTFSQLTIQSLNASEPVTDMIMDPNNPNLVLAHVFGIFQSGDGGVWESPAGGPWSGTGTWTQVLTENSDNGKFAVSRPSGATVTTFLLGLDQSPTTGTCTGVNGTLSQSTSTTLTTWTELQAARGFCGGQCFYDMPVALDPTNLSNIFVGGSADSTGIGSCGSGILGKSTNGGTSFSPSEASLHADSHAIAFLPSNTQIMYTGNDGGIFQTTNGGTTWTSVNNPGFTATQFESLAVHPTDPNFTIGGTQDNGTNFLNPDGVTWTRVDFGDGGNSAIDQNAPDTTNVTMYHTYFNVTGDLIGFATVPSVTDASDGNWAFIGCTGTQTPPTAPINCNDNVLFYAPLVLGPGNPNTIYFGTDTLYRSADQGTTVSVVSQAPIVPGTPGNPSTPISAIGISALSDNIRLVGMGEGSGGTGQVFLTTNGSSTLTDVTGGWASEFIARTVIDPNNPNAAYVTLDGYGATTGHVWKTTNLLAATPTWTSMASGIPDVPVNAFAVDPQNSNNLYAGTDIGVYNSTDGGNTWNPFGTGLPRVAVFDLKITPKRTVRIATHGRGLWEIPVVSPGAGSTTTVLESPVNPGIGSVVTLTATVAGSSSSPVPTGTVAFMDSSTVLASVALNSSGSAVFTSTAFSAGQHTITTAYTGDANFAASQASPLQFTVTSADFSLTVPTLTATVGAGQAAMYTINVAAKNGFTGVVNFSCTSGLPSLAACSFNPTTVTGSGPTTLTISTTAPTAAPPASASNSSGFAMSFGLFGVALIGGIVARKSRRRLRPAFMLLAVLALGAALSSCGGGSNPPVVHNPGTPTGTSNVTITATSGTQSHTATVTLMVQ